MDSAEQKVDELRKKIFVAANIFAITCFSLMWALLAVQHGSLAVKVAESGRGQEGAMNFRDNFETAKKNLNKYLKGE